MKLFKFENLVGINFQKDELKTIKDTMQKVFNDEEDEMHESWKTFYRKMNEQTINEKGITSVGFSADEIEVLWSFFIMVREVLAKDEKPKNFNVLSDDFNKQFYDLDISRIKTIREAKDKILDNMKNRTIDKMTKKEHWAIWSSHFDDTFVD